MARRGLTLVETLLSTVILGIMVSAFVEAGRFANQSVAFARREVAALTVARAEMERTRAQAYFGSVALTTTTSTAQLDVASETVTVMRTVTAVAGTQLMIDVTVVVTFTNPRGGTATVRLATRMRNGGAT